MTPSLHHRGLTRADESEQFTLAVHTLRRHSQRPDLCIEEIPAPKNLAPYAVAFTAEIDNINEQEQPPERASGHLVLLYDPTGHPAWQGCFRLVTYLQAQVDEAMARDPLLPQVGWSWLTDALESRAVRAVALAGTVTQVISGSFGQLQLDDAMAGPDLHPSQAEVQIRASWTPVLAPPGGEPEHLQLHLAGHLDAWCQLLRLCAGLPADAEVATLRPRI